MFETFTGSITAEEWDNCSWFYADDLLAVPESFFLLPSIESLQGKGVGVERFAKAFIKKYQPNTSDSSEAVESKRGRFVQYLNELLRFCENEPGIKNNQESKDNALFFISSILENDQSFWHYVSTSRSQTASNFKAAFKKLMYSFLHLGSPSKAGYFLAKYPVWFEITLETISDPEFSSSQMQVLQAYFFGVGEEGFIQFLRNHDAKLSGLHLLQVLQFLLPSHTKELYSYLDRRSYSFKTGRGVPLESGKERIFNFLRNVAVDDGNKKIYVQLVLPIVSDEKMYRYLGLAEEEPRALLQKTGHDVRVVAAMVCHRDLCQKLFESTLGYSSASDAKKTAREVIEIGQKFWGTVKCLEDDKGWVESLFSDNIQRAVELFLDQPAVSPVLAKLFTQPGFFEKYILPITERGFVFFKDEEVIQVKRKKLAAKSLYFAARLAVPKPLSLIDFVCLNTHDPETRRQIQTAFEDPLFKCDVLAQVTTKNQKDKLRENFNVFQNSESEISSQPVSSPHPNDRNTAVSSETLAANRGQMLYGPPLPFMEAPPPGVTPDVAIRNVCAALAGVVPTIMSSSCNGLMLPGTMPRKIGPLHRSPMPRVSASSSSTVRRRISGTIYTDDERRINTGRPSLFTTLKRDEPFTPAAGVMPLNKMGYGTMFTRGERRITTKLPTWKRGENIRAPGVTPLRNQRVHRPGTNTSASRLGPRV